MGCVLGDRGKARAWCSSMTMLVLSLGASIRSFNIRPQQGRLRPQDTWVSDAPKDNRDKTESTFGNGR